MINDERDDPEYKNLGIRYWNLQARVDYIEKLRYTSLTSQHVRLVADRYDASMKSVDKQPGTILLPEGRQRQPTPNNPMHRWKTPVPGIRNKPKFIKGPDEYVPLKDDVGKLLGTFDVKFVFSNNAPVHTALLFETDGRFDIIDKMSINERNQFRFKQSFSARRKIVEDMADGNYDSPLQNSLSLYLVTPSDSYSCFLLYMMKYIQMVIHPSDV